MLFRNVGLAAICLVASLTLRAQVVIVAPVNGATVSSPVQLAATVKGTQPTSIQVFSDGALIFKQSGISSLTSPLTLAAGFHTILVTAIAKTGPALSAATSITVMPPQPASSANVGTEIASDMSGKNEGFPRGVPLSYVWAKGPVVEMGNNSAGWKALTAWGVVYEASQGNIAVNTRVNIRSVQTYLLQKHSGNWLLLQNTSIPDGAAYLADFTTTANVPGDMRIEPDGTISVTAGAGLNYHFYPHSRASIDPNDIGGIVTIFEARLIVGNPALPDDRNIAAYLAGAGGDYYPAVTGLWPGNLPYNPGIAIGKEKYVKPFWRFFSMSTVPAAQLQSNPPPVNLTSILP